MSWIRACEKADVEYQKRRSDISAKGLYEKIAKGYFLKNAQSVVKNVRTFGVKECYIKTSQPSNYDLSRMKLNKIFDRPDYD